MVTEVQAIGIIGADDHIIAIEMLDDPAFFQRHHPARILVHPVIDNENGLPLSQRSIHKYGRVQLKYHTIMINKSVPMYS